MYPTQIQHYIDQAHLDHGQSVPDIPLDLLPLVPFIRALQDCILLHKKVKRSEPAKEKGKQNRSVRLYTRHAWNDFLNLPTSEEIEERKNRGLQSTIEMVERLMDDSKDPEERRLWKELKEKLEHSHQLAKAKRDEERVLQSQQMEPTQEAEGPGEVYSTEERVTRVMAWIEGISPAEMKELKKEFKELQLQQELKTMEEDAAEQLKRQEQEKAAYLQEKQWEKDQQQRMKEYHKSHPIRDFFKARTGALIHKVKTRKVKRVLLEADKPCMDCQTKGLATCNRSSDNCYQFWMDRARIGEICHLTALAHYGDVLDKELEERKTLENSSA